MRKLWFCIIEILILAQVFSVPKILLAKITYDLNFSNISLKSIKVIYGEITPSASGNAEIELLDSSSKVLASYYITLDYPVPVGTGITKPPERFEKEIQIPFSERTHYLKIVSKNETKIFDISSFLCNHNGVCDANESSLSCSDCKLSEPDNVCVPLLDNVCDPDCTKTADLDCLAKEAKTPEKTTEAIKTASVSTTPKEFNFFTYLPIILLGLGIAIAVILLGVEPWRKART